MGSGLKRDHSAQHTRQDKEQQDPPAPLLPVMKPANVIRKAYQNSVDCDGDELHEKDQARSLIEVGPEAEYAWRQGS
jgi:hypothetical protein